jgi:mannose-6-phosphate isomerase
VDIHELLSILTFADSEVEILTANRLASGGEVYPTPTAEFALSVLTVGEGSRFESDRERNVELIICTQGEAHVTELEGGKTTRLSGGTSIVVPAAVQQYLIEGKATLYKATVPRRSDL